MELGRYKRASLTVFDGHSPDVLRQGRQWQAAYVYGQFQSYLAAKDISDALPLLLVRPGTRK